MIGLELKFGEQTTKTSARNGVVTIITTQINNEREKSVSLSLSGLEKKGEDLHYIDWVKQDLKVGDEITIKVVEVNETDLSEPINTRVEKDSTRK